MKIRRWTLIAGSVILALALTAGVVSAQGQDGGRRGGPRGDRQGRVARIGYNMLEVVAEAIGVEPQDLAQQLREGMTPAEVIEANGGDVAEVTQAVIAAAEARIDEAVANGNLSDTNAARMKEQLNAYIDDLMNREFEFAGDLLRDRDRLRDGLHLELHDVILEASGLDAAAFRDQLAEGMTPAEVIEANGGDVNTVIEAVVSATTDRVETAVSNGNLSEDAAATILDNVETQVTDWLHAAHSFGPRFENGLGTLGGRV